MEDIRTQVNDNTFVLHQSRLKILLGENPWKFLEVQDRMSTEMVIGNLAETLLLEPDELDNRFTVIDKFPSDTKGIQVMDFLLEEGHTKDLDDLEQELLEAADKLEYNTKWKDQTRIDKLKELYGEYYYWKRDLNPNLQPVSREMYETAEAISKGWDMCPWTSNFFHVQGNKELHIQKELTMQFKQFPCAGTADLIIVDHDEETIQLIDLKTTGMAPRTAAKKHRWDIQAAFYLEMMQEMPEYKDLEYDFQLPLYIVTHRNYPEHPRVYRFTSRDINVGKFGCILYRTGDYGSGNMIRLPYKVEGFVDLITKYSFHQGTGEWEKPMEVYSDSSETIELNLY